MTAKDSDIESGDYVAISIDDDDELWFTQTHFAEIRELMKLAEEVKQSKQAAPAPASTAAESAGCGAGNTAAAPGGGSGWPRPGTR